MPQGRVLLGGVDHVPVVTQLAESAGPLHVQLPAGAPFADGVLCERVAFLELLGQYPGDFLAGCVYPVGSHRTPASSATRSSSSSVKWAWAMLSAASGSAPMARSRCSKIGRAS